MKGAKQLRNMIYNILENSDAVSDVTLKNSPNSALSGADFGFYFCKRSRMAGVG